jgi:tetratricopeptide (TPR) repeat protein
MKMSCLIVDLTSGDANANWNAHPASKEALLEVLFASNAGDAVALMTTTMISPLVILVQDFSPEVKSLLSAYQSAFGPMSDFQVIVNSDPSPQFMASVFEFGVEQFVASETWVADVSAICRDVESKMSDPESAEYKTMSLVIAVRSADAGQISEAQAAAGDLATYDFRAAYANGKASEATGDYSAAIDNYKSATVMNKLFRPVSTGLGEACLISGRVDEAIEIFQKLERSNPRDIDRKASLASSYIEKGDFEMAAKYAAEAEKMDPSSSRVVEIKAQVLLCQGNFTDAFALLDQMSDVGPFFAAKLNDLGIKLSKSGKGKSALSLYQKAHKIVRPELKYKITLNAVLACRRLGEFEMALKYVARCAKEYGSLFPKLLKIKETLQKEQAEKAAAAPAAPAAAATP